MHDMVKEYYGRVLKNSLDLKTDACCTATDVPDFLKPVLAGIHDEVTNRYYGCGLVLPALINGARVLDLGCGAGRDVFALSKLVGEKGHVVGVDMTGEQLEVASRDVEWHRRAYGYGAPNVTFLQGYIERLDELPLEAESFDVIVSNCVINLSPDKEAVLKGAHRLLKKGGELYFSDVYADRRLPARLAEDPVLVGECLGGALYWNDFENLAKRCGFTDPRLVEDHPVSVVAAELQERTGDIRFFSAVYRLFKLDGLEPACEDYGQAVRYLGTVPHRPHRFVLDAHHVMETGRVFAVCGNSFRMLGESRLRDHFEFLGEGGTHFGIFPGCGGGMPFASAAGDEASDTACC